MPSSPASPENVTWPEMSMKSGVVVAATAGTFWNTRTTPPCSTTNQRLVSLGAWSIATGALNVRAGNTRSTLSCTCGGPGGMSPPPPPPPGQPAAPSGARAAAILVHRRRRGMGSLSSRKALYLGAMSVLASFRARAAELKREVYAIYLAAKHPRTPWYSKLFVAAIVAYVLSPIDLIPDFIPVLGLLDEIILLPLALVLVVKLVPEDVMSECRARALEHRPEASALGRLGAALIVLVWLALVVLAFMWMSGAAQAQAWPSKPIRLVSPFPPGAVVDTLCRMLAPPLGEALGHTEVVENRPGAGGNVGMEFVAKAPGDGYTLGMGSIGTHGINPSVYARMPFDPVRDFAPITFVASNINVLVVHPSVPANDVSQLVDYAKTHTGKLSYGSAGARPHAAPRRPDCDRAGPRRLRSQRVVRPVRARGHSARGARAAECRLGKSAQPAGDDRAARERRPDPRARNARSARRAP